MADKSNQNFLSKLLNLHNVGVNSYGRMQPIPPEAGKERKSRIGRDTKGEYTTLQKLWSWYLRETIDTSDTLKNRELRYLDLDLMIKNDTVIQMAADLYADEAVQCEYSGQPIRVNAKSEIQNYIESLLEQWGYTQQNVREIIYNKVVYGDAFDGNEIDEKEGIVSVTPLTVWDIRDRLEFNPSIILEKYNITNGYEHGTRGQKLDRLMQNLIQNAEDPVSYFKTFLFGFELSSGVVVPPWSITHFRTFSMQREFSPWGRSRFINALPTFKQLMAAQTLMQVARAASFPRDFYGVATSPGMTPTEQWEAVEEFVEQLDNAGLFGGSKELPSIGSRVVMPKELAEFDQKSSDIDLDKIADIEYLRDNEIMSTRVPKGYLIVDAGGWGNSGQALLQQFKPFGRGVYADQSDFIKELTLKIKMHLTIVNKFQGWDTPFELIMEFPVIEETSERQQRRKDEIDMANSALDTLKSLIGVENIPSDIIKDAFSTMTSIPQERLVKWIDGIEAERKRAEAEKPEETEDDETDGSLFEKISNRYTPQVREQFREQIIRTSSKFFPEGVADGKHFRSSLINTNDMRMQKQVLELALETGIKSKPLKEMFWSMEKEQKEKRLREEGDR